MESSCEQLLHNWLLEANEHWCAAVGTSGDSVEIIVENLTKKDVLRGSKKQNTLSHSEDMILGDLGYELGDDALTRLVQDIVNSWAAGSDSDNLMVQTVARASLVAYAQGSSLLSKAVFFDWYVLCRHKKIRFEFQTDDGFPCFDDVEVCAAA